MDAGTSLARRSRTQHRHELRTLTYVTLDLANGGVVRNLSHVGIGVQAVAALHPQQQVRVRFDLKDPRLRVEVRGEVVWSTSSGQCGIRFLDLSPRTIRQMDEWIFADLLERASLHPGVAGPMFSDPGLRLLADELETDDGLMISAAPLKVIELPMRREEPQVPYDAPSETVAQGFSQLDWLSQPLTGRTLVWTVNALVVFAALMLFVLVFLSVTREAPRWPFAMAAAAVFLVSAMYWGFFQLFGGISFGERLARLTDDDVEREEGNQRFR